MRKRESSRLAHGWRLTLDADADESLRRSIRSAIRAIPRSIADRLPACEFSAAETLGEGDPASRWTAGSGRAAIAIATHDTEPHDAAMEALTCVGQLLWETAAPEALREWVQMLGEEIAAGFAGEIDHESLQAKRRLLATATSARSPRLLLEYARCAFAATAAEYVHCLWHDVTVRSGPEHLAPERVRARLTLISRWFPPDRGDRIFGGSNKA